MHNLQSDSPLTCDTSALTSPEPSGYDTMVPLPSTAVIAGARYHSSSSSSNDELSSNSSSDSMRSVQPLRTGRTGPARKAVESAQRSSLHRQCDSPQRATSEATSEATSSLSAVRTNCAGTTAAAAATATGATASAVAALEHNNGYLTDGSQASGSVRSVNSEHSSSCGGNKRSNVLLVDSDLLIEVQEQHSDVRHSSTHAPIAATLTATATATAVDSASEASSKAADDSSSAGAAASVDADEDSDGQIAAAAAATAAAAAAAAAAEQAVDEAASRRAEMWPFVEVRSRTF
jgi:hypothetical protein